MSFLLVVTLAACAPQNQPAAAIEPTLTPFQPVPNTPTFTPTITPTASPTPLPPTATSLPLPPVSEEYLSYTIAYLRSRSYGGGQIEMLEVMLENQKLIRYMIRYPSDGLDIYGFMNVPSGEGPFPTIILLHGYRSSRASTVTGFGTGIADAFARDGYIVLHPNMRNYPPSDTGDNLYRVGMAVDVLNLIALVKEQMGQPGPFENVDPDRIGLLGQSLGGGVALRVAAVSEDIKAMVLYSSISADEYKNAELFYGITKEQTYLTEMETPPDVMMHISPLNYFDTINASVKLYHSTGDDVVPSAWAMETCDEMKASGIDIDCVYYIGADHNFESNFHADYKSTMLAFFEMCLKGP